MRVNGMHDVYMFVKLPGFNLEQTFLAAFCLQLCRLLVLAAALLSHLNVTSLHE